MCVFFFTRRLIVLVVDEPVPPVRQTSGQNMLFSTCIIRRLFVFLDGLAILVGLSGVLWTSFACGSNTFIAKNILLNLDYHSPIMVLLFNRLHFDGLWNCYQSFCFEWEEDLVELKHHGRFHQSVWPFHLGFLCVWCGYSFVVDEAWAAEFFSLTMHCKILWIPAIPNRSCISYRQISTPRSHGVSAAMHETVSVCSFRKLYRILFSFRGMFFSSASEFPVFHELSINFCQACGYCFDLMLLRKIDFKFEKVRENKW